MLYPQISSQIESLDINTIASERKAILQTLVDFIQNKGDKNKIVNLNFICTHNSRRSHLSQVWAQTMASYYKIENVFCYSGGTEATALFPSSAEALRASGFNITSLSNEKNPVYVIKYSDLKHPVIGFSKTYDADFNPTKEFAAIMTCDSANEACPIISGAEKRIPLTYKDPKAYDNMPLQAEKYLERSLQIATELKYVFSKVNK
ncbi:protein-tyrosine-phosphatase [uncultured Winogradskyella sp.]|uniref:arsenate-mycothiol transferase ArsC n=1 Tax=uncultured Winogradskyella sp. TaxID=395353 RepID=UPI00260599B8|nr:protein-tyrosine-phosphatase [uncultured Winogradskyella sp.]